MPVPQKNSMLLWNGRLARQEQARCLFHKKIQSSCGTGVSPVRNRQDACSTKKLNLLVERASSPFLRMV
ncbi:hypothetical protein [Microcoleus sp. D2_18a_B4]|uniref:hypothetical protein n=1 Tax=Microcoleus sp. D2_18a_B4 TaxID=3055329 RepID=UPI002FD3C0D1